MLIDLAARHRDRDGARRYGQPWPSAPHRAAAALSRFRQN
jgi:hypothetical protein